MHQSERATPTLEYTMSASKHDAEYVLPIRRGDRSGEDELVRYLQWVSERIDVTIVDGSDAALFRLLAARLPAGVQHVAPSFPGRNGKARGVMTGLHLARWERVIVADDDVRYGADALAEILDRLDDADFVRPQNVYTSYPWYARLDTARMLIGRAFGGDFGGTVAVRRSALLAAGGYCTDVLFENLEMERTVGCAGGRVRVARDLFIGRVPPTSAHFSGQRVRQAYDDFAQPVRLVVELALLPLVLLGIALGARRSLALAVVGVVVVAEAGRRAEGGSAVFPGSSALWAPLWVAERAVAIWLAAVARLRGGVRYSGGRIASAGTPRATLRRRVSATYAHARAARSGELSRGSVERTERS